MVPQSYDDIIITPKNVKILNNLSDYSQTALDYFSYDFKTIEFEQCWSLLKNYSSFNFETKLIDGKRIRLPSCSLEDKFDYDLYLKRLHHCVWRRWSMSLKNSNNNLIDPLSINWNKENDLTVLYGPDFYSTEKDSLLKKNTPPLKNITNKHLEAVMTHIQHLHLKSKGKLFTEDIPEELEYSSDSRSSISSGSSSGSGAIFDNSHEQQQSRLNKKSKLLNFNDFVVRWDIDENGLCYESHNYINDLRF
ncbi:hypothetical protein TPHA_0H01310 [Tetrapisispora phaffii CBS 4417]|uniref:Uncharacterized protein n=1 Tax=Tetrapisispora phaffii (strain ATCC 24235 / CBS 4417 / NBRC 1672 / NRRL Y-8282 / UCD 70-5) TaxID=1071381 RepID=G8BX34_TETPH|nr:hypothetical protein TPHA_0H01310 [Tetrapisispora phaffii CBS 4417]CCE64338.1 hypothetical protein TPHA_0H01310 [Tetrapisispora phaffii CBS 4417]